MIHIYYGDGKGKTTSAIGLGMRANGAGMSVSMVQFLKNNKSSELNCLPFDIFEAPEDLPFNPNNAYQSWVDKAIDFIESTNSKMIILDEMLDVIPNFISIEKAKQIALLDAEIIITGHKELDFLIDIADYVTYMQKQKHPFDKGIAARKGVEY